MKWFQTICMSLGLMAVGMAVSAAELKEGDDAPDWEMKGTDGKTYKLSQFKGKQAVVVAWYPKAKTGGCTKECKSLREHGKALREFQVAYFGASCDTVEYNKEFSDDLKLDFPLLCDPDRKVAKEYGLVTDDKGNPKRWTFIVGLDGKIAVIDKQVKVDAHGDDIAKKLKELGVPRAEKK